MNSDKVLSLRGRFCDLTDPCVQGRGNHQLVSSTCMALCGADAWVRMKTAAKAKEAWFGQSLKLENGIPSHDTFGDAFAKIASEAFQKRFIC